MGSIGNGAAEPAVGVVVAGHGRFAADMVQTLRGVVGEVEGVEGVVCWPDADPEAIRADIGQAVERVDEGAGVIVFTDMLGDTATNASLSVAGEHEAVEVVAGVNMPMLIKLTTARTGTSVRALAEFIRRYGQEHIFRVTAEGSRSEEGRCRA